ncbi:MAG: DUF2760 domain-containing protein [Planctomycetia bacterium]|nr:DUF2760 domain-containing protein [Planctomycetia bacterium]
MEYALQGILAVGIAVIAFLVGQRFAKGEGKKEGLAWEAHARISSDPEFAKKVNALLHPPPPSTRPSGVPVRFLALLQREGRLLDFLLEDVQSYQDAQIGAAVRDIHRKCQHALKEHLVLEPVLGQAEGSKVEVPKGFDPSAIQLTGNVSGQPPFSGTLQHHGWRVKEIKLAPVPEGQDDLVLMPAEVEIA